MGGERGRPTTSWVETTWVDGAPGRAVPADDRGLHYGDGLFETVAVRRGVPVFWERHMTRLAEGCARLRLPRPDPAVLQREADALCRDADAAVLKVVITRGSGGRGYRPPAAPEPRRVLSLHPWPGAVAARAAEGVRVITCRTPLGDSPALAGLKHLNRLEQVLARAEWDDPDIPEGLMADTRGRLVEGTMGNLFAVRAGALVTPPVDRCGVRGIMRGVVMEQAAGRGLAVSEAYLDLPALVRAEEVFLTNSIIGLWPVLAVDGAPVGQGRPGPVTRWLQGVIGGPG